jgi:hypothetical protein
MKQIVLLFAVVFMTAGCEDTMPLRGDVNGDGLITISDALMITTHLEKGDVLTSPEQIFAAVSVGKTQQPSLVKGHRFE